MSNNRNGITVLESVLATGLIAIVASLAVTLVQLGNKSFQGIQAESIESRELLRFASDFRRIVHRAVKVEVAESGHKLVLFTESGSVTDISCEADGVALERREGQQIVSRESYNLIASENAWKFSFNEKSKMVEASPPKSLFPTINAVLGLLVVDSKDGESDAKQ